MCSYKATYKVNLRIHKRNKHEGVRHACHQCDYKAMHNIYFKNHNNQKHEGVQFCCKLYDYKASHINATTKMNALKNTAFYTVVKKVAMTKYVQRFKLTFN